LILINNNNNNNNNVQSNSHNLNITLIKINKKMLVNISQFKYNSYQD